jgi:hypothetical protein
MSGIVHSLVPGLQNLGILSDKDPKTNKNGLQVLANLCLHHLINKFDPTSPVDFTLDDDGKIVPVTKEEDYPADFHSETSSISSEEIPEEIPEEIFEEIPNKVAVIQQIMLWVPCNFDVLNFYEPSDVVDVYGDSENEDSQNLHSEQIAQNFNTFETAMDLTDTFKYAMDLAKSGNFDFDVVKYGNFDFHFVESGNFEFYVVKSFLQVIILFLDLVLTQEHSKKLQKSLKFFRNSAIQQLDLFSCIMETQADKSIIDLLHDISFFTESQKEFLRTRIAKSDNYNMVTDDIGAACKLLLDLQEVFILKLIVREQGSNEGGVWC